MAPEGDRLAVEITIPSTRVRDLTVKRDLYGEWNVPYLIVDRSTTPPVARRHGELPLYAKVLVEDLRAGVGRSARAPDSDPFGGGGRTAGRSGWDQGVLGVGAGSPRRRPAGQ